MESSNKQQSINNKDSYNPELEEVQKFLDASREASHRFHKFALIINDYALMDEPAIILRAVENMRTIVNYVDGKYSKEFQEMLKNHGKYRRPMTVEKRAEIIRRSE